MTPAVSLVRARVMHTPRDPFSDDHALECFDDGAGRPRAFGSDRRTSSGSPRARGGLALGLGDSVGDLSPGREADFVLLRPPAGGTLEAALARCESPGEALGALITLAREESVAEARVAGSPVYTRGP